LGARRLLMVITQEPTQSLTALHGPGAADACIAGEQQDVVLPLMIALGMVMLDVFAQGEPQGALAEEDYLRQALLLYRPDPALRIGIVKSSQLHSYRLIGRKPCRSESESVVRTAATNWEAVRSSQV
jgi:hypothetical protein